MSGRSRLRISDFCVLRAAFDRLLTYCEPIGVERFPRYGLHASDMVSLQSSFLLACLPANVFLLPAIRTTAPPCFTVPAKSHLTVRTASHHLSDCSGTYNHNRNSHKAHPYLDGHSYQGLINPHSLD
jgi:hypothetical protein